MLSDKRDPRRDPRVTPKRGDVLSKGRYQRRVIKVTLQGAFIDYATRAGVKRRCYWVNWQQWAKDAEVVLHAE